MERMRSREVDIGPSVSKKGMKSKRWVSDGAQGGSTISPARPACGAYRESEGCLPDARDAEQEGAVYTEHSF